MKKFLVVCSVICVGFFACGFGGPAPSGGGSSSLPDVYMIDNFEDGDYTGNPVWWKFDNITANVVDNSNYQSGDPAVVKEIGKNSLNITGNATDWYAGGMGTYIAKKGIDLGKYNSIQMDVYGNGSSSGAIKIELVDDDKGNWQIEQDSRSVPLYDDKFVYTLTVDWTGWKRVYAPFSDFTLDNPGRGDGVLTVSPTNNGGGLLEMQLIFIASSKIGSLGYNISNIALVKR